jgi:hypothetical protein
MWCQTGTEATNWSYDDSVVMNSKRQVVHLPVACLISDWFQAAGQLPYLQHFNPISHPFRLYILASLYQSFSLRVLDVVMDHQKKYPCQTRTKKLCEEKTQYRKFVFSCRFQKPSNNLWILCDRYSWLWLPHFICFKKLCMDPSASIDSSASFDFNWVSFLYNEWSSLKTLETIWLKFYARKYRELCTCR